MATWYVATTGNDANPGTPTSPFLTIEKGITSASSGDTVVVASGTYTAVAVILAAAGITVQAASQLGAVVSGGFDLQTGTTGCVIDGFAITGATNGINAAAGVSVDAIIRNCYIHGNTNDDIFTDAFAALTIENCRSQNDGVNGIESASPNLLISDCIFCSAGTGWHFKGLAGLFAVIRGSWFFGAAAGGHGQIRLTGAENQITITSCIGYTPTNCFISASGLTFNDLVITLNNVYGSVTLQDFVGGYLLANTILPSGSYAGPLPCGTPGPGTEPFTPSPPPTPPPTPGPGPTPPPPSPSPPPGPPPSPGVAGGTLPSSSSAGIAAAAPPMVTQVTPIPIGEPLAPPQLKNVVPPLAERYIRSIQQAYNSLLSTAQATASGIATLQKNILSINSTPGTNAQVLTGTHDQRAQFPPSKNVGAVYFETDRGSVYRATAGGESAWVFQSGFMIAPSTEQPTGFSAADTNFVFYAVDLGKAYRWSGSAWIPLFTT